VTVTQLAAQATGNRQDLRIKIFQAALAVTSWAATGDALFAAGGWSSGRSMSLPLTIVAPARTRTPLNNP
jgi:hypothetical protein